MIDGYREPLNSLLLRGEDVDDMESFTGMYAPLPKVEP